MKDIDLLLRLMDEAYDKHGWQGPTVRATLRGIDPETAAWRPEEGRHNIRELVVHIAYWKHVARRRLVGLPRRSFAFQGSNWFERKGIDASGWKEELAVLQEEHRQLRIVVTGLRPS